MLVQYELVAILNDLLGQHARLRKGGEQATYHCPFCPDKNLTTKKLEIAVSGPKIGNFHCWRCNTKGRTFGGLLKKLRASNYYREAIFKLTGDIRRSRIIPKETGGIQIQLPEEFRPLYQPKKSPEYKNALAYLIRRGLTASDIYRYNIGYCEDGEYERYIIIPSYDAKGKLNFFIGRKYYGGSIITYKKPNIPMGEIIGFESFINWNEPVNLVEGVFDAFAVRNNAIPLFGKYLTRGVRHALVQNRVKRINLILDSDATDDVIKDYIRIKRDMTHDIDLCIIKLPGKDPAELGFKKIHGYIRDARPFTELDLAREMLQI